MYHCYLNTFGVLTVTSNSISVETLADLVSRISLNEGVEKQPSSHHMLEVPLEAVTAGKDVDNKESKKKR